MKFEIPMILMSLAAIFSLHSASAQSNKKPAERHPPATLKSSELTEFPDQPPAIQKLIKSALALTRQNLTYRYGSADPKAGGMDCSGTVHYLIESMGIDNVPRQANHFYKWVWNQSRFHSVVSHTAGGFEMSRLKPGDLLFWTGTYDVDRDPPVTHVMMFLGTTRKGKPVMFGASNGRSYQGRARNGVSVFDFRFPKKTRSGRQSRFIGYGSIPGLRSSK